MSWLYSQALVEEYLGDISLDGEQSVQSSGSHTQQAYCAPDKMTGFSRLSRFGMTYKPLTESRGKELLTLYLADFHAKTSPQRGGGAGIDGERSGMWREMARIICEVQPRYVFVENSPMLTSRGLGRVLGDLASMGFDAKWGVLGANSVGAPHQRERIWIHCSNSSSQRWNNRIFNWEKRQLLRDKNWDATKSKSERERWFSWVGEVGKNVANSTSIGQQGQGKYEQPISTKACSNWQANIFESISTPNFWSIEPNVDRVADGLADRVHRLKAIGNGQVPLCAATAWRILK